MALSAPSKLYADDVSLVVALLDANPFFWAGASANASANQPALSFSRFLSHVLPFLNSILLVNQLNHVVVIAAGVRSCGYVYDSGGGGDGARATDLCTVLPRRLEEFVERDRKLCKDGERAAENAFSLLSGSLSLALCYIQRVFRSGAIHPQPRILCLQGSPDGPEQYVAVMNAIFSAQRSMPATLSDSRSEGRLEKLKIRKQILSGGLTMANVQGLKSGGQVPLRVPIDSCVVGIQHSAFLQQASHITGGVYLKPQQLDGLFQYLSMVFATDLQSRSFLQLPKPAGVDFRASCFCHKKTIDRGYVCSVCLSIFCKPHKKCSTCGSDFKQASADSNSKVDSKRKTPEA